MRTQCIGGGLLLLRPLHARLDQMQTPGQHPTQSVEKLKFKIVGSSRVREGKFIRSCFDPTQNTK